MDREKPSSFDSSDSNELAPVSQLRGGNVGTETIDLSTLLDEDYTDSGSFDIGNDIWTSTFGKVIQALPLPVLLVDESQNVVVANRACAKISTGYESILNKPFRQLFATPSVATQCQSIVTSVFATRKSTTWDATIEMDQNKIWGRVTLRSVRIRGQRFLLVLIEDLSLEKKQRLQELKHREELEKQVEARTRELRELNAALLAEIADRKRSEKAAKDSEMRFRVLFEQAAIGVAQVETASGRFMSVNGRFARIVGYTPDALQSLTVQAITHPDDFRTISDHMDRLTAGQVREFCVQGRYVRKDGSLVWINLTVSRMLQRGEMPGCHIAIVEDISERRHAEELLRQAEQRYRSLFDRAPLMYVITQNRDGVPFISDCNELFLSAVGYEREDVLSRPLADFYSQESRVELLERGGYARALAGSFSMGERQLLTRDGTFLPTLLYTTTELDGSGKVVGTRAMFVDISERKKMEQALRESEERFRSIFANDHAIMLIIDPETGRIEDASPGACAFYGYTRDQLTKKRITEINTLTPEEIAHRLQEAKTQQRRYFEFRHRLASGEVRDVEVCTGPIVSAGRTLLFSIVNDVTAKKKAQESCLQSEKKYRALFDESKDGVYSVLRTGVVIEANPSFLEIFGYSREKMIGKNIMELYVDSSERPKFQKEIEEKGFVKDYEVNFRKKDGTEISCLLTSSLQFDDEGSIVGYRGILRDLTIRKKLQRQLFQAQKMEAIGTLAGGIAHDFNNLLTIILGFSELLLIGKDERDPAYTDLQKIHHSARSGADLIKRILTFSRKSETNPRPLNLNREIDQVKNMLTRTIPKMIKIELALADELETVSADPTQIEQILMNLAVNAKDAMPEGGTLTIATNNVTLDEAYCRLNLGVKPGNYVLLSVSDTGQGMDADTLQHIFEPFYTTKGSGGGTGLGLAMVYGIVEQHHGHITCSSKPGSGTTFDVYFPVISQESCQESTVGKASIPRGTETILLVDDEEFVRDLGKRILERSGYQVRLAANGKEALQMYQQEHNTIALVILDLIMPEMGGGQCLEELLKIAPGVKVIIASGYAPEGQAKCNVEAARAVVGKPYDIKKLLHTVREVLDQP